MTSRLKTLRRIEAVHGEMVKLTTWRLAAAEKVCCEITADIARLRAFIDDQGGADHGGRAVLGPTLARAAQRSLAALHERLAAAQNARTEHRAKLESLLRREHAIHAATRQAATAARREEEARDLTMTMEIWLAARSDRLQSEMASACRKPETAE